MTATATSGRMAEILEQMADLADELNRLWDTMPADLAESWTLGYPEDFGDWADVGARLRMWVHALD